MGVTNSREWQIGIVGTFDVENYGDLLFPYLAEAALSQRLGTIRLRRFSYHAKTPPTWPYSVNSLTEFPLMIGQLDALLIGGGFLLRFDKAVAPNYAPPVPEIHHPTGYWLTPALMALQHNVPVIWNAPGMHCNEVPAWARPLVELALTHSRYIAVRDELTQVALNPFTNNPIALVPDTAFGIASIVDEKSSDEFLTLQKSCGLTEPYIVVQAALGLDSFHAFVKSQASHLQSFRFLALPIGPVLGDHPAILRDELPNLIQLPNWPSPLLIAELIRHAVAVVGHSYHLQITALAQGVPAFSMQDLGTGKYTALRDLEHLHQLDKEFSPDLEWFLARLGKDATTKAIRTARAQVEQHWDRVAEAILTRPTATHEPLNRFWQALPTLLEDAAQCLGEMPPAQTLAHLQNQPRTESTGEPDQHHADLPATELTVINELNEPATQHVMRFSQIAHFPLENTPYQWAAVNDLFSWPDAAALADTFPCDHFKLIAGYGGEKDYEYEARQLIGMGASEISYSTELSETWQALAKDFLSPAYRQALSGLTGCDLTEAPLEVNVFHYGPGASLGPHLDLPDKVVTHVLYFNHSWNPEDGGCLNILGSADPADRFALVPPIVGTSAVLVRSDQSWHAVSPVVPHCQLSRRSLTATFYHPGSVSSMWPPDDTTPLHTYQAPTSVSAPQVSAPTTKQNFWSRLKQNLKG